MIHLDYSFDPAELSKADKVDLATASRTDLDYYLFCGSIFFRIDGANFDADWGWIPVLDFATQLFLTASEIKITETGTLAFTESEATIEFRLTGSEVEVSAEYASAIAKTPLHEMQQSAATFFRRVLDDLTSRWPKLVDNPFFNERIDLLNTGSLNK